MVTELANCYMGAVKPCKIKESRLLDFLLWTRIIASRLFLLPNLQENRPCNSLLILLHEGDHLSTAWADRMSAY